MEHHQLTGITWGHTRGYIPMVATAQRFSELRGGTVGIQWDRRSLQDFADASLTELASRYELLVIDHPAIGLAASALLPLDEVMPRSLLDELAGSSVGASFESYYYDGHLYGLPIDAATPVAAWRPDLLAQHGVAPPRDWEELQALADQGLVAVPGIPLDTLMALYMLCCTMGSEPFTDGAWGVPDDVLAQAIEMLAALYAACGERVLGWNPIAVYEAMSTSDDVAYCPFAYGYANYARVGYARYPLAFGDLLELEECGPLRSTLGGAGLAVSRSAEHVDLACAYAAYVAGERVQRTLYFQSGGQPAHRAAWLDGPANEMTGGFFAATLPALDRAYLRPRRDDYIAFQGAASRVVHAAVTRRSGAREAARQLRALAGP